MTLEQTHNALRPAVVLCAVLLIVPGVARARLDRQTAASQAVADKVHTRGHLLKFGPTSRGTSKIVIDAKSGVIISSKGAEVPRYPASLTKLMTLDLAFQALRTGRITLKTRLPVTRHVAYVEPVKLGLRPGSTIGVHNAILAMTTMSANDAATALGDYLGGGNEARFAHMMTLRAHALGMAQTHFSNPSGLPNPNQVTTARDMSILARDIVISYPEYAAFFKIQKFNFRGRTVYSNNQMLKLYPGATGLKTGYTDLARHNLITSAKQNDRTLIGVVLHDRSWPSIYRRMTVMLNTGFSASLHNHVTIAKNSLPQKVSPSPGSGFSLIPSADAAITPPEAPVVKGLVHQPVTTRRMKKNASLNWKALVGSYSFMKPARIQALKIRRLRGVGVPRVVRVASHGKILWSAQLTELSRAAAVSTCSMLKRAAQSCLVISSHRNR